MGERRTSIHASFITLAALFLFFGGSQLTAQEDNFRWQDTSQELDALAFSQSFIDSVKNKHLGKPSSIRSSRQALRGKETLVYEVQWGLIKAGFMILTTEPDITNGHIRVGMKMMSNNFVSSIHRIRDYSITWVDDKEFYPIFFEQHIREKKFRRDQYIIYDNKGEKLFIGARRDTVVAAPPFTHNFVSALHYARTKELKPGDTFTLNMYTRPKVHAMRMRVRREERVSIGSRRYNCLMIEPTLVGDGERFNKNDHMTVWIAQDDAHRVPVMAKTKLKVGSITARLVHITRTE